MATGLHPVGLHTVVYDAETDTCTFSCAGDKTSYCHVYPVCDCEWWDPDDHEHESVANEDCWLVSWFEYGGAVYDGDDAECCAQHYNCPPASGWDVIATEFDGEAVTWQWADKPRPLAHPAPAPVVEGQLALDGDDT